MGKVVYWNHDFCSVELVIVRWKCLKSILRHKNPSINIRFLAQAKLPVLHPQMMQRPHHTPAPISAITSPLFSQSHLAIYMKTSTNHEWLPFVHFFCFFQVSLRHFPANGFKILNIIHIPWTQWTLHLIASLLQAGKLNMFVTSIAPPHTHFITVYFIMVVVCTVEWHIKAVRSMYIYKPNRECFISFGGHWEYFPKKPPKREKAW